MVLLCHVGLCTTQPFHKQTMKMFLLKGTGTFYMFSKDVKITTSRSKPTPVKNGIFFGWKRMEKGQVRHRPWSHIRGKGWAILYLRVYDSSLIWRDLKYYFCFLLCIWLHNPSPCICELLSRFKKCSNVRKRTDPMYKDLPSRNFSSGLTIDQELVLTLGVSWKNSRFIVFGEVKWRYYSTVEGFSCHEKSESEESIQLIQIPSPKSFLVQLNKTFLGETEQEQEEFSSTYGDAGQLLIDSVHGAKKINVDE